MKHETRLKAAGILLVLIALHGTGFQMLDVMTLAETQKGQPDEITWNRMRYADLKPLLPRDEEIGFLSDMPNTTRSYYTMRYALSPLRIANRDDRPVAVGSFRDQRNILPVARQKGYVIERDFGAGVVLLRKRTP